MRTVAAAAGALLAALCASPPRPAQRAAPPVQSGTPPAASATLPRSGELAYAAVGARFDRAAALEIVSFMDRYWRLAGNPGFDASIDHIHDRLLSAGFTRARGVVRVEVFPNSGRGWDYRTGTLEFGDGSEPPLLSRERDRVSLAINSFSTTADGLHARLIDVGSGAAADYEGKDLTGAVVLGDAPLGRLWQDSVKQRGAAGIVSTSVASYIRPADPASMSAEQRDVLQWGSVPYDERVRGFGFKASWRAADRMRQRLKAGSVTVRVIIDASFYDGPNRTLVAEIPGRSRPDERIVMAAHVQEPGANDDGSGCGTLYAIATALAHAIESGALPPPERTLTFLWVDEIRGSRRWLADHSAEARGVQYMFSMDMTGEDTTRTGGTFLIEKQADPTAVWTRPSDPHTEWGGGGVTVGSLKGSLLNDLHLAVCLRRARESGWVVRTNPYEGGSDHTVFAGAGVPSVLNWHFTDRYYHTNQDRLDKVSAAEMQNVGTAVATSAWILASAGEADALSVVDLVADAGRRRLTLEREQGRALVERAADRASAEEVERRVAAAWIAWYDEALDSVLRLPAAGATERLRRRVADAKHTLRAGQ